MPKSVTSRLWLSVIHAAFVSNQHKMISGPATPYEVLKNLNNVTTRMPSVHISVSHGGVSESFVMDGVVSPSAPHPVISQNKSRRIAKIPSDGIGAWIQNIKIRRK
jgi:hypothetical protein